MTARLATSITGGARLAVACRFTARAVALFDPTLMVVALFASALATSLFISGLSQVAIGITGRTTAR